MKIYYNQPNMATIYPLDVSANITLPWEAGRSVQSFGCIHPEVKPRGKV
jgi:hypothetical protein